MIILFKKFVLLLFLFSIFFVISFNIKHKKRRLVATILLSFIVASQILSMYKVSSFIGYRFLAYLSSLSIQKLLFSILLFTLFWITLVFSSFYLQKRLLFYPITRKKRLIKILSFLYVLFSMILIIVQGKLIYDTKTLIPTSNYHIYQKDTKRYIAHAGGEIDGKTYTNCLEALDLNYKRGFRLFELDIRKTIDGQFVAVHQWDDWIKYTNYKGKCPVSYKEFLSRKIDNKYTPLDMKRINQWFESHKDAILVTDKVNQPNEFIEQFCDKNRLMMELFTKDAVNKALKYNILSVMPSQRMLSNISNKEIEKLAQQGIRHIVVSIDYAERHQKQIKKFQKNNIQPYVYGLNFVPYLNEQDITLFQMDYIYGIYAEKWNFK